MKHENSIDNSSEIFLRQDALKRLEWDKITNYLADFSIFPHSKILLSQLKPWLEIEEINLYFLTTSEMLELNTLESGISLELFDFSSYKTPLSQGSILSPHALFQISITLKLCQSIQFFFTSEKSKKSKYPNLFELASNLKYNSELLKKLNSSIDINGNILSTASLKLQTMRSQLEKAKQKIVDFLEEFLKKQEIRNSLQDNIWMLRDGRYVLPVRVDRKTGVDGISRGLSQSGSTIFIEPSALSIYHSNLEKAQTEVEIEENRIIRELSKDCYQIHTDILNSAEILTQFDIISARTKFANAINGVQPTFITNNEKNPRFSLINAKHPLFLLEKKDCIANDLQLKAQNQNDNSPKIWVLSGPNAGGKTVTMKTVGITALMAKAGLFVSCTKAEILNFQNIFVELGDRQSREEDLSTFSGHLAQLKKIAEKSNEQSLILLDEGFVGTDPAIGVALARATLEYFAQKKATVIITTHFSNLKTLANNNSNFQNGSMEFEPYKLLPTYKLLNGIPGQSYAIELAERMGLNNEIIKNARSYYGNESQRMENILKELQVKRIEISEELYQQNLLTKKLEAELKSLNYERTQLSDIRNSLVDNYRNKLQKRLNAFENRLEIRERQFEKKKESLLNSLSTDTSTTYQNNEKNIEDSTPPLERHTKRNNTIIEPTKESSNKPKKLSSFEALSDLKLSNNNIKSDKNNNYDSLDYYAEKFRTPKNMSKRSLLDEAKISLNNLQSSFNDIDEQLNIELNTIYNVEKSAKEKAKNAVQTAIATKTQGRNADFWKVGMTVLCNKFKESGVILKEADSKGFIQCQFGVMKIKVSHHELLLPQEQSLKKIEVKSSKNNHFVSNPKQGHNSTKKHQNTLDNDIPSTLQYEENTIHLRGSSVLEAIDKLDISIDKMHTLDIKRIVIIHGHGMGKIKDAVRKYLEDASYKLRFRNGRHGEGGDGVTIVEFDEY